MRRSAMKLTPPQAHYVLEVLVSEGTIRSNQIVSALSGRKREIADLRKRLATLEALGSEGRPRRRRTQRKPAGTRRRPKLSPKVRALRKLQGKYMGYIRGLSAEDKARVRAAREKEGIRAGARLAASIRDRSA